MVDDGCSSWLSWKLDAGFLATQGISTSSYSGTGSKKLRHFGEHIEIFAQGPKAMPPISPRDQGSGEMDVPLKRPRLGHRSDRSTVPVIPKN